ncbi:methionine--tRNA ligase [Thiospirochaeta perfilievii]|uniref:Methionine--tRNA ligase n=1 Tax=Thiospirochaeta perfilievii TaxID=252967 RepID=A0A5C1QGN5_9SPIO|nr:methionine--tRNA ligase [Thiospirochaeta perfilievii]QEN05392.1 methionine--tRNA ligase [Thiospirochaeta perfilievii]
MKKRLVTSALPYVNNVPHLGNLIQVLSADVYARYCRSYGYETLYVCGTDEHGTATETKALQEGVTSRELCDKFHDIHVDIYNWFNINFDHFGRTSKPIHHEIVQDLFKKVDAAGYITEKTTTQLFCTKCDKFLADRFVKGTCPHCDSTSATGDQCEDCGKLLDPTDLIDPKCGTCGSTPESRDTTHLYLNLPGILPKLEEWMEKASIKGQWAKNAVAMTKSWIRDGLRERCITRDLKWGIQVPKEGFEDKVFYVWFDAPIGYVSITADKYDNWQEWWMNPDNVELFQFIGKDNIPFHTVIFPSTQLESGENWTMLHHMSSSEYLNYENGKFSKSKGVGVFGNDCKDTGIPADVWRFYIFYNRPEKTDTQFTWADFQEKVNSELIGNLSNLVNRTLTFADKFFDGKVPDAPVDEEFWATVKSREEEITSKFEMANLRETFKDIFHLSSIGNKAFQDGEPWRTKTEDPAAAAKLLKNLIYLVKDLAILIEPFIPETSAKILSFLGQEKLTWKDLGSLSGITEINKPTILFTKLEDKVIEGFREKYAGSQADRAKKELTLEEQFRDKIDLRAVKIVDVQDHPEADKLYVETVEVREGDHRTIVSGIKSYYTKEELIGKTVILAYNLKPANLRGVKSQGMLLAAEDKDKNVEVIFLDDAKPGERVVLDGENFDVYPYPKRIKIDTFFDIPLKVVDNIVMVGDTKLVCNGNPVLTKVVKNGDVG